MPDPVLLTTVSLHCPPPPAPPAGFALAGYALRYRWNARPPEPVESLAAALAAVLLAVARMAAPGAGRGSRQVACEWWPASGWTAWEDA